MATTTVLYLLNSTDDTSRIVIQPGVFDGAGGVQRNTDLTLYGNGTTSWGERFNENFFHLLENFATAERGSVHTAASPNTLITLGPVPIPKDEVDLTAVGLGINNPVEGQFWFNKSRGVMFVYTGVEADGSGGYQVGTAGWKPASNIPVVADAGERATFIPNPRPGEMVFRQDSGFEVYDGAGTWSAGFVQIAGDTMTGFLTLHSVPTAEFHAATKGYVDSQVSGGVGSYLPLAATSAAPITGTGGSTGIYFDTTLRGRIGYSGATTSRFSIAGYASGGGTKQGELVFNTTSVQVGSSTTDGLNMQPYGTANRSKITNLANPTSTYDAVNKTYADVNFLNQVTGGTVVGNLYLGVTVPTADNEAASKYYVDQFGGTSINSFSSTSHILTGLTSEHTYLVHVYGITRSGSDGQYYFGTNVYSGTGTTTLLASTGDMLVSDWPDGKAPISASLIVDVPIGVTSINGRTDATTSAGTTKIAAAYMSAIDLGPTTGLVSGITLTPDTYAAHSLAADASITLTFGNDGQLSYTKVGVGAGTFNVSGQWNSGAPGTTGSDFTVEANVTSSTGTATLTGTTGSPLSIGSDRSWTLDGANEDTPTNRQIDFTIHHTPSGEEVTRSITLQIFNVSEL